LSGNNGVIDMTGANVFVASSSSLSGNPVKEGDTSITESKNGVTGSVNIDSYSGNHTVIYRHEMVDDAARAHADLYGGKAASIIGGNFKITDAAAGSTITLVTGNTGVSTTSTAYTDKNLGNLKGYVRIAEGLTSSSITKALQQGDISFYNADEAKNAGMTEGQGHYSYSLVYPNEQVKDPMATVIDGSRESKDAYRDAGIYKDKTDTYDFTKKPATVNTDGKSDSIIHAGDNDVNVKTNDVLNINAKDGGIGMKAENGKTVTTTGNTNITAKDGTGILADKGIVKLANDTTISAGTGMEAKNGGTITAEGKANITATGNALHADGDGSAIALKDGTISGKVLAENKGTITTNGAAITGDVTAASDGTVSLVNGSTSAGVTADGGTITTNGTEVAGNALAKNSGTVAMTNGKAASLTADGGTVTTNGTEVTGDALAKANGTVSMTNGKAASVTADGGTASTDGTTVDGLISAKDGGTASMKNGSAKGLSADKDSTITATLDKSDAKLDGNVANEGNASISLSNGASWTGDSTGTGTTTANIGSGSTWTGTSSNGNTKVALEGTWKQTGDSTVDTLTGKGGTLDKSTDGAGETKIASYSGNMSILYSHNESTPTEINGAVTTVGQAADGSSISLITDSKGLSMNSRRVNDRNTVSETFNQLAHKLHYTANDGKLAGRLKIAEGLTSSSAALRTENITFDKDGIGTFVYDPAKNDIAIEYGSDETRMMKGTKSALLGSAMMWRSNNNDIQRRMGDLRLGQGETGVWARYMGGKNKYDQQNTYLNQDYDIGQAGFDKKVGDWTVGLAIDHGDGKSHYIGGKGKEKMNTLAIYGTRVSNDGRYFDVIVKTGQVKNKFDVSNEIGNKLHGDYKAWGNSISLEYGKRFVQDSGFYMDPSVEFTAGRLNGKNFKGTSDLGTLYVHQHGFNSAIGRIGFSIGRQQERSNIYAKFALAHEFGGNFRTDFYADDGGLKSTKVDLSDTWLDMELGGSLSLGKNVYLYGTYTRTFEADMATKWRADVGVRYTF
ncbi:autotransporter outer membrane beta-barrel domain-containing protein, partial [uncultured Dialister sp.]|uniref:autotransporter outer membrane beta-barrel domain-containing protein n=1 Tax=uncultured Dialister sp. TaxID=278064 RepID=UPI0025867C68